MKKMIAMTKEKLQFTLKLWRHYMWLVTARLYVGEELVSERKQHHPSIINHITSTGWASLRIYKRKLLDTHRHKTWERLWQRSYPRKKMTLEVPWTELWNEHLEWQLIRVLKIFCSRHAILTSMFLSVFFFFNFYANGKIIFFRSQKYIEVFVTWETDRGFAKCTFD